MTHGIGRTAFFGAGSLLRAAPCLAVLALASCAATSLEDAAPVDYGPGVVGPKDTGTYPNLNIAPQQAAPQFTEADRNAKLTALAAEKDAAARAVGAGPKADAAQFDELARTQARQTLEAIGSPCDPALDPACK